MNAHTSPARVGLEISGTLIDRRRHLGVGGFTTSDARVTEQIFRALLFHSPEAVRLELFGNSALLLEPDEQARFREQGLPFHRLPSVPDVFLLRTLLSGKFQAFLRQRVYAARCARRDLALMHYTGAAGAWGDRALAARELVMAYDLYPERMNPAALEATRSRVARRLDTLWVSAISSFTAQDVVEQLGVPAGRVISIPLAVDHDIYRPEATVEEDRLRLTQRFPEGFVLFVGSFSQRKNFPALAEAMERLNAGVAKPIPLVMAGPELGAPYRERQRMRAHLSEFFQKTPFTEILRPTDTEMAALYRRARVLVHPSVFEGFGLTVLEALACGCPVVCGRHSSLVEVGGPAAVFVEDVRDPEQLCDATRQALSASEEARRAREKIGLQHASTFTWERFQQGTVALYRRILGLS